MKNALILVIQQLLKLFFVFPIKSNRVFFSAYSGKNYACNPKYICEFLLTKFGDNTEIIWAFTDPGRFLQLDKRIKRVRFKSVSHIYYYLTSRVVVDNVESWSILPKRKKQYVINTWHGGGAYKGVGNRRRDTTAAVNANMFRKHKRVDLYLSSSKVFTCMTLRNSFGYEGEVLECGMPRNDILLSGDTSIDTRIRSKLGISPQIHLALYAPTFRNDMGLYSPLDISSTLNALKDRFGGQWLMLYRAHYYLKSDMHNKTVLDVTDYPDMQELLLICDVLITDYSSSIWDFSLMRKPAFLYTPDLKTYNKERDFYTPIKEWPYPYACTSERLADLIRSYDQKLTATRIELHHRALGICETGTASEQTVQRIAEICELKGD